MEKDMLIEQPKLGRKGMIALITAVNMIAPLSTDMYMAALPHMAKYFKTTDAVMNFTLVGFFLFFAVGMILFGPISDKYGRRPVFTAGIIIYGISCVLCGISVNIVFLILMRILQALGAGCMISVTTAMIKDQFTLSLHEALPISYRCADIQACRMEGDIFCSGRGCCAFSHHLFSSF